MKKNTVKSLSKVASKICEVFTYLVLGYVFGGCSNTGTVVLHANVMNNMEASSTNQVETVEN